MWGGGGPIGVGEDKSWPQRDTKKEVREDRSYSFKERYELLLLGADKEPSEEHRNPEMCHRTSQDLPPPLPSNSGKTVAAYASHTPPIPHLVFASLARRSGDCCADAAPLSCLPDCRLRPLTPTTPAKEHVTCCCIIMGTKSEFNNSGQDIGIKKQLQFWVGGLPVSVVCCAHPALI